MPQKVTRYLALVLILTVSLWLISPLPAAALSLADYFQLSYDPVSFSKNEIHGSEAFHATIVGRATCSKDLPVSASEASITSRIIAEHAVTGTSVILNASYTISIKPFPSKEGDSIEINQDVPLKFPAQAESGDYNIIGQLIEAKVKVAFIWGAVTDYLPQDQLSRVYRPRVAACICACGYGYAYASAYRYRNTGIAGVWYRLVGVANSRYRRRHHSDEPRLVSTASQGSTTN